MTALVRYFGGGEQVGASAQYIGRLFLKSCGSRSKHTRTQGLGGALGLMRRLRSLHKRTSDIWTRGPPMAVRAPKGGSAGSENNMFNAVGIPTEAGA